MEPFFNWFEITQEALASLWSGLIIFIPKLIGAIIVFLIGWLIAAGIGKLITEVLRKIKLNQAMESNDVKRALEKADLKIDFSGFIGVIFKWILIIVFLLASIDILGFQEFSNFLSSVVAYLPNIIVAVFIFVVAIIIADLLEKVVKASAEGLKAGSGNMIGNIAKWAVWFFALFAILEQLIPKAETFAILYENFIQGIVYLIVIVLGLSFGLGGKEVAADILHDLKRKLRD